jgi:hypothetical protein
MSGVYRIGRACFPTYPPGVLNGIHLRFVAAGFVVLASASACSSVKSSTRFGVYRASTASGQAVTVVLNSEARTARLTWIAATGADSTTATTQTTAARMVLDLASGLSIDLQITGDNRFSLSYPQYPDGEPESGAPVRTLNFTLIGLTP